MTEHQNDVEVDVMKKRALELLSERQSTEALEQISMAISIDPDDVHALMIRAMVNEQLEHWAEVIDDCSTTIALDNRSKEAYFLRGKALMASGRTKRAIRDFTTALEIDDKFAEAYEMRGECYAQKLFLGEEKAIDDLRQANSLQPNNASFHFNIASTYTRTMEYHPAIEEFTKAIDLDPTLLLAYRRRGYCEYQLKHIDQALDDYNHVLRHDPSDQAAHLYRGNCLLCKKMYAKAIEDYDEVIKSGSKRFSAEAKMKRTYAKARVGYKGLSSKIFRKKKPQTSN